MHIYEKYSVVVGSKIVDIKGYEAYKLTENNSY